MQKYAHWTSSEIKKSTISYLQSMIELNYAWSTAIISWRLTSCDARWLRSYNWIISLALSQLRSRSTSHYWNYSHWVDLELYVRYYALIVGLILLIYIVMRKIAWWWSMRWQLLDESISWCNKANMRYCHQLCSIYFDRQAYVRTPSWNLFTKSLVCLW